jgi:cytochrome P450
LGFFQHYFADTLSLESSPTGLFTYSSLGCRRVVPFTPNAVSYFTNSKNYVKTEITRNVIRRLTGDGVLVVDGIEHRRQRKLLNPAFASEHIKNLIGPFWAKGCELTQLLEDEAVNGNEKGGYDVLKALTRTTLDIIGLAGITKNAMAHDRLRV